MMDPKTFPEIVPGDSAEYWVVYTAVPSVEDPILGKLHDIDGKLDELLKILRPEVIPYEEGEMLGYVK